MTDREKENTNTLKLNQRITKANRYTELYYIQ